MAADNTAKSKATKLSKNKCSDYIVLVLRGRRRPRGRGRGHSMYARVPAAQRLSDQHKRQTLFRPIVYAARENIKIVGF